MAKDEEVEWRRIKRYRIETRYLLDIIRLRYYIFAGKSPKCYFNYYLFYLYFKIAIKNFGTIYIISVLYRNIINRQPSTYNIVDIDYSLSTS